MTNTFKSKDDKDKESIESSIKGYRNSSKEKLKSTKSKESQPSIPVSQLSKENWGKWMMKDEYTGQIVFDHRNNDQKAL